jgi:hypothetical protein
MKLKLLCSLALFGLLGAFAKAADPDFLSKDNWEGLEKYWKFEGSSIIGKTDANPGFNTFFCSKTKYTDFELHFDVKLTGTKWTGNSGVQIRSEIFDKEKFKVKGPQCDMGDRYWGSLYGEGMKEGMLKASKWDDVSKVLKPDDFNDYYIKVVGKKVTIKINGVTTVDQEFEVLPPAGVIALQIHAGNPMEVIFKNIKFKNLAK